MKSFVRHLRLTGNITILTVLVMMVMFFFLSGFISYFDGKPLEAHKIEPLFDLGKVAVAWTALASLFDWEKP